MGKRDKKRDVIHIDDLSVECIIGVYDWEREVPQRVNLSMQVPCDCAAALSDELEDAVDYKRICKYVTQYIQDSRYQLIEALIENLAAACLKELDLPWIRLRIDKPGALRGARTVGIEIYREA